MVRIDDDKGVKMTMTRSSVCGCWKQRRRRRAEARDPRIPAPARHSPGTDGPERPATGRRGPCGAVLSLEAKGRRVGLIFAEGTHTAHEPFACGWPASQGPNHILS